MLCVARFPARAPRSCERRAGRGRRDEEGGRAVNAVPRWLLAAFAAMLCATLGAGAWFYFSQRQSASEDAGRLLESIARSKMESLLQWRTSHLSEAAEITASRFLTEGVARWFSDPRADVSEQIRARFRSMQNHIRCDNVLLVDANGRTRLSLSPSPDPLPPEVTQAVAATLRERKPMLTALRMDNSSVPRLEAVAPIFDADATGPKPAGAVVLQIDARETLYPLIRSWPVPARTAEALLLQRDGDTALLLNELRHRQGTALKLRIPLTQTHTPAVQAVLGAQGILEGRDDRGVDVLSALMPIPQSPWFLVVQADAAEVFAPWRFRSMLILALILGCVLVGTAGIGIVWQRNLKAHYRSLLHAETARRDIEKLYRSLFDNMLNGFAYCRMIREDGRPKDFTYLAVNNAFGALTGLKDVVGKKATEVIPGILENDPELLKCFDRVARTGAPEKFETYMVSMKMWFSISVYRPQEGHFVTVFDVITRRKQAEQAMRESEERYRLLADNAEDFVVLHDAQGHRLYVSPSYYRVTGWTPDEFHRTDWRSRVHPDDIPVAERAWQANMAGQITTIEYRLRCRDGSWIWAEARCNPIFGSDGKITNLLIWSRDITARKRAETSMREGEALLRSITDHSEDMIFVKDRDSRYLYMNPAGLRLTATTLEQIRSRTDLEWNPNTEEAAGFMAADHRVVSSGQSETVEETVTSPQGARHVFLTRKTPRLDANGNTVGVVGICRDITKRKRAEDALRESEERFRSLYASMTETVALHEIVADAEGKAVDYRILDINPAFTKITGIPRNRAVGALASTLYGTSKAPFLDIYARVAASGEPASFDAFFKPLAKHFEISVFSPQRGQFATVASDISARKEAERCLAKQQTLLEGMNRILQEAIRCENENDLATRCLAITQELTDSQFGFINELNAAGTMDCLALTNPGWDACNIPYSEATALLKDMPVRGIRASVIQSGKPLTINDTTSHPDPIQLPAGHPPIHRLLCVPLKIGEKAIGLIALANKPLDYSLEDEQWTESLAAAFLEALQRLRARQQMRALNALLDHRVRERTTQLETANKELESFSYSVSHDLRAPLRAISGFAGMLAEDHAQHLNDEGRRLLGVINNEASRMGQLIDDLLHFSRAGRRPLQTANVDMHALAQVTFDECRAQTPRRDIRFQLHPLPPAQGDAAMLRQVWTNLISNAVKYTRPKTDTEINITGHGEDGELIYTVRDNGVGFDMEHAQNLFGVFQRLHSENEFEGTGVGLALVQRIIHRHGGRVWAEARPGEGAAFHFTLPARKE
jgi:PAS domain S-box-containing protein